MHTCPIERCTVSVSDHYLMCKGHWRLVSEEIRSRIYATWNEVRKRQRRLRNEPDRESFHKAINEYRAARNEAIACVEYIIFDRIPRIPPPRVVDSQSVSSVQSMVRNEKD